MGAMTDLIPLNRVHLPADAQANIERARRAGRLASGGHFGQACEAWLERQVGCRRALLTGACTHALEMCALLLELQPGDEVIMPSFTFVSTANAFALHGARPVFVDIRPDTLNIDPARIAEAITARTRAIVVVHYAGVACDMDPILALAERHGIPLIEDNAHGLYGEWRGQPLGSFGALATLSFHETKNIACGEGGALLINDPAFVERAHVLRDKGTNRQKFLAGRVAAYTWVDVGSSYGLPELLAAVLLAALEEGPSIQRSRQRVWQTYRRELAGWCAAHRVDMQHIPEGARPPAHLFCLLLPSAERRAAFIRTLREDAIEAAFHYLPLEGSPMAARLGAQRPTCRVSADVSARLVRLPLYAHMAPDDLTRVVDAVRRIDW